jgi:hypothetical protein
LIQKEGDIQVNIGAPCGKQGLSRRPGLAYKQTAITAGPMMSNNMKGDT